MRRLLPALATLLLAAPLLAPQPPALAHQPPAPAAWILRGRTIVPGFHDG